MYQYWDTLFVKIVSIDLIILLEVETYEHYCIRFRIYQHSALSDAYNTAELLILTKDEKEFKKKAAPVVDLFKESEPLTYSLADKLKGIKIA